jgi:hypothetical protein
VCRCADRAWRQELRPFALAWALFQGRGRNQRACSLPYSSQLADAITSTVIWAEQGRSCIGPSSTVFILAPSRGAGDPTSIAWQSRPNSTPVPVVKTCLLIPLWLMAGLLEISSLFLSRPPQALFASWAQPVFIMSLPIRRQRTWDGLEGQRARSTLNFTLVL